ncbi:hypothetical protein K501DRAFT_338816 [Backusella circina FSU 941]|nr:hypothetical protein K501DRAFT_338816 [Backusella circina FSU 941]
MSGILYVKNLPSDTNNHNLYDLFRPFGPMYLCKILIPFKGAALVQYFHSESAQNLEHVMNNKVVQGNIINITPYISAKQNGEVLLTSAKKNDRIDYTNLYVKNLHFNIKSSDLFNHFRRFGKIISARVMKNPQTDQSKGFGFVSFNKAEEAIKAQAEMNGYLILSKPIIVAFHEPNKKTLHMKSYQPNLVRSPTPPLESCSCCPTPTTLYPQQKQNVDYTKQHIASSNTKESAYFYVDTNSKQDKNVVTKKYTMKRELSHPGYPPLSTGCYKLPSPLKEFVRRKSLETSNSNNSNGEITYIRRDRVAKAVFALNKDEKNLNEIVDMLLTLHKRDLATCLFNESFLIAKIQQAKEALDVFREENLNDVLFPPKESRAIAIISPVTKTAIQIDKVFDLKALKQLSVYEQKKTLGDHLFPLVKLAGIKHAPKVTISLLDTYTIDELAQIMHDQNKLNKKIAQLPITTTNP